MELIVYKTDGTDSGKKINLPDEIFNIEPNTHLIYQAVRMYLANRRQGTHKTKERNEVRGGGRKPFRQKGTGRARQGTSRSPLMVGGGTIFGPKPHKYTITLPKKAAKLARKSALSLKAKEDQIKIIEDFSFNEPKTSDFLSILKAFDIDKYKTLLLLPKKEDNVYLSGRNLPNVSIMISDKAATYDLLNNKIILIQESAVKNLCNSLQQ
ncbi:MAG: 50S ribosomal protein L4 [Ignavibacteria bacterium]|nr:50S ribosomal protein L4 [Ignavibacteria bacterium]